MSSLVFHLVDLPVTTDFLHNHILCYWWLVTSYWPHIRTYEVCHLHSSFWPCLHFYSILRYWLPLESYSLLLTTSYFMFALYKDMWFSHLHSLLPILTMWMDILFCYLNSVCLCPHLCIILWTYIFDLLHINILFIDCLRPPVSHAYTECCWQILMQDGKCRLVPTQKHTQCVQRCQKAN